MIKKYKAFKSLNELKSETYLSAASKLRSLGHESRAVRMEKHAVVLPTNYVFNAWICRSVWKPDSGYNLTKIHTTPIEINLASVYFDENYFNDIVGEYKEFYDKSEAIQPLALSFAFKSVNPLDFENLGKNILSPNTQRSIGIEWKKRSIGIEWKNELYGNGLASLLQLLPEITCDDNGYVKSEMVRDSIGTITQFMCKFSDRKSAVAFKKFLHDMLFNKIKYYSYYKDKHTYEDITVSDAIRDHFIDSMDFGLEDVHRLYKVISNVNVNRLYME